MKLKLNPNRGSTHTTVQPSKRTKISSPTIFVGFLILSTIFWYIQSLQETYSKRFLMPVIYEDLSGRHGLDQMPPQAVEVVISDRGVHLFDYAVNGFRPIKLKVQNDANGDPYLGISRKDLLASILRQLSNRAQISSVSPAEIYLPIFRREEKKVPIQIDFEADTGQGFIASAPTITPDSVTVYGSANLLSGIHSIKTAQLPHEGLTETYTGYLSLISPSPAVKLSTSRTRIRIPIEELTERSFDMNVEVEGTPDGKEILPLPAHASVVLTLPGSKYNEVMPSSYHLTATYPKEGTRSSEDQLQLTLRGLPDWVVRYTISPSQVQYVIEQKAE